MFTEAYLKPSQTSTMELFFAKTVNGFYLTKMVLGRRLTGF